MKSVWPATKYEKSMLNNVQNASGDVWKDIRSVFSPIFTSGRLRKMTPLLQVIKKKMDAHVSKLAESNSVFENKEVAGKFSLDALASCAFGVKTGSIDGEESEFLLHTRAFFNFDTFDIIQSLISSL